MAAQLDALDLKLLTEIQQDCSRSSDILGDRIGLSGSAVQRRLKALRKNGVITAEIALIDACTVGNFLTIIAMVQIDRESAAEREKLKRWCRQEGQVQQAYFTTGSTDLVLVVLAKSISDYDSLMGALQEENPNVRRVTTNVSIEPFKAGLSVPLKID